MCCGINTSPPPFLMDIANHGGRNRRSSWSENSYWTRFNDTYGMEQEKAMKRRSDKPLFVGSVIPPSEPRSTEERAVNQCRQSLIGEKAFSPMGISIDWVLT